MSISALMTSDTRSTESRSIIQCHAECATAIDSTRMPARSENTCVKRSVSAGMAIFDTMNFVKPDVSTLCTGMAASMGAFLLAAGAKGKRFALPHSRILIHQPYGQGAGQAADIEIAAKEILKMRDLLNTVLAHHTGQPVEKVAKDTDRDFIMSADEAREYGIIDGVIVNRELDQVPQVAGVG